MSADPTRSIGAGRHSGLLVPLFSMPSSESWGIGEIADLPLVAAWLAEAQQDLLQLLPINEMAVGQRSPYSAMTAMAIDPIYIAVRQVEEFAAIGGEAAMDAAWRHRLEEARRSEVVDYVLARSVKEPALRAAFECFRRDHWDHHTSRADALEVWAADQAWWLDDYALFRALHAHARERSWFEWPDALARRDPAALDEARHELADQILFRRWLQWVADSQWRDARRRSRPVALLGDLPFMVDGDSADVWADTAVFRLDASVGAPPDAFSATGQNWGMPAYRWDVMAERDYRWLRARARRSADLYDGYRIDHLVGFYRTYAFPNDGSPAHFSPADPADQRRLGETLLGVFASAGARIIAEDLGIVPDFVRESLARLGVPGFKVFRWERHWHTQGQPYRDPAAYPTASVATSGTHDTETVAVWWEGLDEEERRKVLAAPGVGSRLPAGTEWFAFTPALRDVLLEVLFASASDFLVLPFQDLFGWRDRINIPGSLAGENWTWRLPWPVDSLGDHPEVRERAVLLREWSSRHQRGLARP